MTYHELQQDFVINSRKRWRQLVKGLAEDDPARLQLGCAEIAFSIPGLTQPISDESLSIAFSNRTRGWHTFSADDWHYTNGDREEIERWKGDPDKFAFGRGIANYGFGRIQFMGNVYLRKGFQERWHSQEPGTVFDITTSICDVGCMLLYAANIADSCGDNLDIAVTYSCAGLCGRRLDMSHGWFERASDFVCNVDVYCSPVQTYSSRQIMLDLRCVLLGLMAPMYSKFAGYVLDEGLIDHYVYQEILGNYPVSA